jgi:hypothetical protein
MKISTSGEVWIGWAQEASLIATDDFGGSVRLEENHLKCRFRGKEDDKRRTTRHDAQNRSLTTGSQVQDMSSLLPAYVQKLRFRPPEYELVD